MKTTLKIELPEELVGRAMDALLVCTKDHPSFIPVLHALVQAYAMATKDTAKFDPESIQQCFDAVYGVWHHTVNSTMP